MPDWLAGSLFGQYAYHERKNLTKTTEAMLSVGEPSTTGDQ